MPRLASPSSRIGALRPKLTAAPTHTGPEPKHRQRTEPWRKWYGTARWQKLRRVVFLRDLFTCQKCGIIDANTSNLRCDHVKPHRGNEAIFWNGPHQTLCPDCHDRVKQREEQETLNQRGVWD